jgi:phosphatidate cytidylyltransferase
VLIQRVISAAIGVPVILVLIYFGGNAYMIGVAAGLALAAAEFQHITREWLEPATLLTAALVAGIAVGARAGGGVWLAWLAAAIVIAPIAALLTPTKDGRIIDVLWALGGVTYVGFLGSFIVMLRYINYDARSWVYLTVLGTFAVDTAAYFVGRAIGKHKLAPRISPKKTIEGMIGGYVAGLATVVVLAFAFQLSVTPVQATSIGVLLPTVAVFGDLAESAVKRAAGIKDTSEIIPGHGGVLDRLDSILFAFALVYLFTQFVVR